MNGTNLPTSISADSSETVKQFFDKFYQTPVSFPAAQIDAVVAFFQRRGFDVDSARSTAIVMLNQAKSDNIDIFKLLDSLNSLTDVQMNQIVAQVLNSYRENTSLLGYRVSATENPYEARNVVI
jgi:S-adenosylmethionine:diacylglycerol 3-amino-3-carboxypropyl transferase